MLLPSAGGGGTEMLAAHCRSTLGVSWPSLARVGGGLQAGWDAAGCGPGAAAAAAVLLVGLSGGGLGLGAAGTMLGAEKLLCMPACAASAGEMGTTHNWDDWPVAGSMHVTRRISFGECALALVPCCMPEVGLLVGVAGIGSACAAGAGGWCLKPAAAAAG